MNKNEVENLLNEFKHIRKDKKGKTFLEIAGYSHHENVWSNLLAFYLNPVAEHGFGNFIIRSFLQLIGKENVEHNYENIKIHREYRTKNNNRLDILIETDTFVLGIENKVNASLYNDLEDYARTIDELSTNSKITYKIVLSKYKCHCDNDFVNVLYSDLIKLLLSSSNKLENKYQILFQDFLDTIFNEINYNSMNDNPEMVDFFTKNQHQITELLKYSEEMNAFVFNKLKNIHENLKETFKNRYEKEECFTSQGKYLSHFFFKSFICQTSVGIGGVNYGTYFYTLDWKTISDTTEYEFLPTFDDKTITTAIEDKIENLLNRFS